MDGCFFKSGFHLFTAMLSLNRRHCCRHFVFCADGKLDVSFETSTEEWFNFLTSEEISLAFASIDANSSGRIGTPVTFERINVSPLSVLHAKHAGEDVSSAPPECNGEASPQSIFSDAICKALHEAGATTRIVDEYFKHHLIDYFETLYFAHGRRTVAVTEGPYLSTFQCTIGCKHPHKQAFWPIPPKQRCQAILDHVVSRNHCNNCHPEGVSTSSDLNLFWQGVKNRVPRAKKWDDSRQNETRTLKPRKKRRKEVKPEAPLNVSTEHITGIVHHCLNELSQQGLLSNSPALTAALIKQTQPVKTRTR